MEAFVAASTGPFSPADVAEAVDVKPGTIRNYLTRMSEAGDLVSVRHGVYIRPDLASDEASGDGSSVMGRTPSPPAFATPAQLRKLGLVRIPALTVQAGAGPPYEVTVEVEDEDETGLVMTEQQARILFGFSSDRLHTIRVRGDSMMPTLSPGDTVVAAKIDPGAPLMDGAIYILLTPEGLLIKRLRFRAEYDENHRQRRYVRIISDNPDAESWDVPADVFERDYKVRSAYISVFRSL